jgi:hypothetical protein
VALLKRLLGSASLLRIDIIEFFARNPAVQGGEG